MAISGASSQANLRQDMESNSFQLYVAFLSHSRVSHSSKTLLNVDHTLSVLATGVFFPWPAVLTAWSLVSCHFLLILGDPLAGQCATLGSDSIVCVPVLHSTQHVHVMESS